MTETVRVKREGPRGWHNISKSAFDPEVHELVDGESVPKADTETVVDVETIHDKIELGEQIEIPDDWSELHWTKQEKLALELVGGKSSLVTAEGQSRADKAKAIIQAVVAERA